MKLSHKLIPILGGTILFLMTCFMVYGQFVYFTDKPLVQYLQVPFKVQEKVYKVGDKAVFSTKICVDKEVSYSISQKFREVNTNQVTYIDGLFVTLVPGCVDYPRVLKEIPKTIAPGEYKIEFFAEIPGTVRTFPFHYETEVFTVE